MASRLFALSLLTFIALAGVHRILIGRSVALRVKTKKSLGAVTPSSGGVPSYTRAIHHSMKRRRNKLVWLLHYHKAAGTSFTELAWKNNETVRHSTTDEAASEDRHGHLELNQHNGLRWELVWPNRPSEEACQFNPSALKEKQSKLLERDFQSLQDKNITFVSTEHWFPPNTVMQRYRNQATWIVLLREPMERLISSYHFHNAGANRCPLNQTQCSFADWWPAESNMHVKMLMGIPFGPLKVGKTCAREMITSINITKNDYQEAVHSLETFDAVLTLDSVKEQPEKVACVLSRALGWNETSMPEKNVKLEKTENVIEKNDLEKAQQGNTWDIQLYKRAQELERQTFQSFACL